MNLNIFREVLRGGTLYSKKKDGMGMKELGEGNRGGRKDMENHRGKETLDFLEKKSVYRDKIWIDRGNG